MLIERIRVGTLQSNTYIITDQDKTMIIDAGDDAQFIISKLSKENLHPQFIISTHGHFDHNLAVYELILTYKAKFMINKNDEFLLKQMKYSAKYFTGNNSVLSPQKIDRNLKNNDNIKVGNLKFNIIETPGHTPGSICLYEKKSKVLFTGDLIFKDGNIGRYDFSYSDKKCIMNSIRKILILPDETTIYPGHGDPTSIGYEKIMLNELIN